MYMYIHIWWKVTSSQWYIVLTTPEQTTTFNLFYKQPWTLPSLPQHQDFCQNLPREVKLFTFHLQLRFLLFTVAKFYECDQQNEKP